jgi:hypothetical protein
MTKEDFIIEKNSILFQIDELKTKMKELESQYIEKNREFKDGDVVLVTIGPGRTETGIVDGYEKTYFDDIKPIIKKIKKDGSPSQHRVHLYFNGITITKIEK